MLGYIAAFLAGIVIGVLTMCFTSGKKYSELDLEKRFMEIKCEELAKQNGQLLDTVRMISKNILEDDQKQS